MQEHNWKDDSMRIPMAYVTSPIKIMDVSLTRRVVDSALIRSIL